MRTPSRGVVIMAIAGFVAIAGIAPFCPPPAQGHTMPCCDAPESRCPTSLTAAGCCRVEPGSASPLTPGARLVQMPGPLALDPIAAAPRITLHAVSSAMIEAALLALRDPVPLFLLNASLLR